MIGQNELNFLERVIQMIGNHGFLKIIQALFVIGAFFVMAYYAATIGPKFKSIIDTHDSEQTLLHDEAIEVRKSIQPQVNEILTQTRINLHADRAFVIELHNGTNNASGLPFNYGNMTYEKVAEGIEYVADDYNDISLSRFTFPLYMENNHVWQGTIEELAKIDDRLAKRMSSNGVTYMAITHLNGVRTELGYFGVTYCDGKEPSSTGLIIDNLITSSQKLSILLDASSYSKVDLTIRNSTSNGI